MNFYSNKSINIVSFLVSLAIFLFLTLYIPKLFITLKNFIYFKVQPTTMQDYE